MASERLRVCVIGAGGREHALARALGRSTEVVVSPGNTGMAALGVPCTARPPEAVDADLFVIGPEAPLVGGLADRLRARGHLVLGPGADGARLEGSKAWMKEVLAAAGVPTAAHGTFDDAAGAMDFLRSSPPPWVVKTDGLAAGKGVLVTDDLDEACADVVAKLSGEAFGDAGRRVVLEEGLAGEELSLMALCDGVRAVPLAVARDFKRVGDGDSGPNTGGMGAYSPVPGAGPDVVEEVMAKSVLPALSELRTRGVDFRGVLYAGLMLTDEGPKVLEFNVRFGDPEAQVVLPRWSGDVSTVLLAAASGHLEDADAPLFSSEAAVCVVLAAPGYPDAPELGQAIHGFDAAAARQDIELYPAGISAGPAGELVTSGGRVLALGATGPTLGAARDAVYEAVPTVWWPGVQYRHDIAAHIPDERGGR